MQGRDNGPAPVIRELGRDCAFTAPGADGRARHKLRGRVFKGRKLTGDVAEWVVLDVVHRAVHVLRQINTDPTHLFGYRNPGHDRFSMVGEMPTRLDRFRDHVNSLFGTTDGPFIPPHQVSAPDGPADNGHEEPELPWHFDTLQFRRTLAWHIAHQPFGVVAGAKQYKHAKITVFEGYAGGSESGFAAEVAAEEAVALLDYVEDLYRDWDGHHAADGVATDRVDAEFDRVRQELGDLPGIVSDGPRLRAMLNHLTKTLHPGLLNDCFFNAATAVCVKRATTVSRRLPMLNTCLRCPNARRSTVHLPRLHQARLGALELKQQLHAACTQTRTPAPILQQSAIDNHIADLDEALASICDDTDGSA